MVANGRPIKITRLRRATDRVALQVQGLLAQLSPGLPPLETERLREILVQRNLVTLAAWRGPRLVGLATMYVEFLLTRKTAWIEDVVVDQATRGGGVGQQLMEALIETARVEAVADLNLTSRPDRLAANALYVKLGFETRETNVYRLYLRRTDIAP